MPTVVFQNLPDSVNSEKLSEVLSTYAPHAVNISIAPQKLLLRFEGSSAKLPQLQDLFDLVRHLYFLLFIFIFCSERTRIYLLQSAETS